MRTILFKAKKLSDGKWVKGSLVKTPFGTFIEWYEDSVCNKQEVDSSTVCQFTGLKDKEGMDIFEGDLLYDEDSGIVSAIKWKRNICGYVYEKAVAFATMRVFSNHTCFLKVIGNKFDRNEKEV